MSSTVLICKRCRVPLVYGERSALYYCPHCGYSEKKGGNDLLTRERLRAKTYKDIALGKKKIEKETAIETKKLRLEEKNLGLNKIKYIMVAFLFGVMACFLLFSGKTYLMWEDYKGKEYSEVHEQFVNTDYKTIVDSEQTILDKNHEKAVNEVTSRNIGDKELKSDLFLKNATPQSAYSLTGTSLNAAYDLSGNEISPDSRNTHIVSENVTSSTLFTFTKDDMETGWQGFAVDNTTRTIIQLHTGTVMTLINMDDGSFVQRTGVQGTGHGNAGSCGGKKIAESDLHPPVYVSPGGNLTLDGAYYGRVAEFRIRAKAVILNRVFFVPIDENWGGYSAIDFDNNILYHFTRRYYSQKSGDTGGYFNVYAYDFTEFEPLANATYESAPVNGYYVFTNRVDKFTVPYIESCQSVAIIDGLIAFLSDAGWNGTQAVSGKGSVVFVDPQTKSVYLTLPHDKILGYEREGIGCVIDPLTNKPQMLLMKRLKGKCTYALYTFDVNTFLSTDA